MTDPEMDPAVPGPRTAAAVAPAPAGTAPAPRTAPSRGADLLTAPPAVVAPPDLPDLGEPSAPPPSERPDLRLLADVPVDVSAELGRLVLPLADLLELSPGAVVQLDREVDAPVDLLVNGLLLARGEVVVVDGRLGVRVVEIVRR